MTFNNADKKLGGAGRLGVDAIVGFVIVVEGLIKVFAAVAVIGRVFAATVVNFPLACARI